MKTISTVLLALTASAYFLANVEAHGYMTGPTKRKINAKYRADCLFGLKGAGDEELQLAPLENLRARGQADQPAAPTFDIMNGCRGIEYQPGEPTTTVTPGQPIPVTWMIQAPHSGWMEMHIVRASKDSSGKVTYKQDGPALKRIDNFATSGGDGSTTVTLPSNLSGCETPGNCGLQFYWYSAVASQTYVTCADIVTSGSGGGSATPATTPAPAGSDDNDTPAATPAPPAATPPAPSSSGSVGSEASLPAKKACKKRMRQ